MRNCWGFRPPRTFTSRVFESGPTTDSCVKNVLDLKKELPSEFQSCQGFGPNQKPLLARDCHVLFTTEQWHFRGCANVSA